MIRRESVHLYKLCVLNAIWRKKLNISKDMIRECYDIIMECIDSIKTLVSSQNKDKKIRFSILKMLATNGSISKMQLHFELEDKFKVKSPNTKSKIIKQLVDTELVTTFESGRNTMVMISDKGREWLDGSED
jgi:predicted transcriptional regulator